jgi:hypothetical protein
MPTSFASSTTKSAPTFFFFIRRAAASTLVFDGTVTAVCCATIVRTVRVGMATSTATP